MQPIREWQNVPQEVHENSTGSAWKRLLNSISKQIFSYALARACVEYAGPFHYKRACVEYARPFHSINYRQKQNTMLLACLVFLVLI